MSHLEDGAMLPPVTAWQVLVTTSIMASATGLGGLPFFFLGRLSGLWAGVANALACGVMLAASFDLIHEGEPYGGVALLCGIVLGGAFVAVLQSKLSQEDDMHFAALRGGDARKMMLMVAIMTAHAFGEGAGVGVSFAGRRGWAGGAAVAAAIALHNVPEGLAVASVLVAAGVSPGAATRWAVATHAPQAVVAVPAFLFVEAFRAMLPTAMGFAAGCMIWMAIAELLPDALAGASSEVVATVATLSATALEAFRMGLAWIEAGGSPTPTLVAHTSVVPSLSGLSSSVLLSATMAAVISGLMVALGGIAALTNIGASGSLRGDGARVLGAAHGAGMALGLLSLASATLRGHGREAAVGAVLGVGAAWGVRMQLRRSSRMDSSAVRAKDEEGGDDVAPSLALPFPPTQETRSAIFVSAMSLAHAAAEGLVVGAAARATGLAGESFARMLLPGLLPGALRGAVYAVGMYGITHSARAGFSLCLVAAFVQEIGAVAAMLGPGDWVIAGGFVHRAANLAAGALVATSLMEFWPRAARQSSSSAAAGAVSGAIAAGAAAGVSMLLSRGV